MCISLCDILVYAFCFGVACLFTLAQLGMKCLEKVKITYKTYQVHDCNSINDTKLKDE